MRGCRCQLALAALAAAALGRAVLADSVVPIAPGLSITPLTADSSLQIGDVLTFVLRFSTVPNGAQRGLGSYATFYIPAGAEVVGARMVDANGATVVPERGGLAADGVGPRGPKGYSSPLVDGSIAQLYADTGIFYSTDPRTERRPVSSPGNPYISAFNGLQMPASPTGVGQFDSLYGVTAPRYFAHNEWDLTQAMSFGPTGAVNGGTGNTPEHIGSSGVGYGSPVAGPQTWYGLETTIDPPGSAITTANAKFLGSTGPWMRIRERGSLIGRRGAGDTPPTGTQTMPSPGLPTRLGIPALDGGNPLGRDLSADNPLPAGTKAVRFALGELLLSRQSFAEVSLRVTSLPLDAGSGMNLLCAEVFAGDASSRNQSGTSAGKDNPWRYFLPIPDCMLLDLHFENQVDKLLAVNGSSLTYTIEGKNLSASMQQNVVVRDCFRPAEVTLVAAGTTPGYTLDTTGSGCPDTASQDALVWTVGSWAPGASLMFSVQANVVGSAVLNQAVYTSETLPAPGRLAAATTVVGDYPVIELDLTAMPSFLPSVPASVHYTARVENTGTAVASLSGCSAPGCSVEVILPAGFAYTPGSALVDSVSVADPAVSGPSVRFASPPLPPSIAPGVVLTIELDVAVGGATPPGLYASQLRSWLVSGQEIEDVLSGAAAVAVVTAPSAAPLLSPLCRGGTTASGTSAEPAGSTVRVYVNGNPAGTGTTAGGGFAVAVATLFAGQQVTATVQAAGELESPPSPPLVVASGGGTCFHTLSPCRVVDTRGGAPPPPIGGPILTHGFERTLALAGQCSIPLSARAVSLNITAVSPLGAGALVMYPTAGAPTNTAAVSFNANGTRASNAVFGLNPLGQLQVLPFVSNPTGADEVHLVVDVNGYFE